nr:MAG TPA: hypothetical protein [Caudoviricetes sp.]
MIKAAGLTEADFTGEKSESPEPGAVADPELEKRVATVEETVEAVKIILMGEDKS